MKRIKKSWMAVAMGALLMSTLVGVVWARPHDRPEAADITRKVTLVAGDFVPSQESYDYTINATQVQSNSGQSDFTAAAVFPCLPSVTVERIKLHLWDDNASWNACAKLFRMHPPTANGQWLVDVCSPAGKTPTPQTFTSPDLNEVFWPSQRAVIYLQINSTDIYVFGVTIEYHRNI